MPTPIGVYADTFVANTDRLPSGTIWESFPWEAIRLGEKSGLIYFSDFFGELQETGATITTTDVEGWTVSVLTAGTWLTTAATATNYGGIAQSDAGDTTAAHGPQGQLGAIAGTIPFVVAGEQICLEMRVRPSGNVAGDYAFGLFANDTTIITSAPAVSTANQFAFTSITGNGVLLANANKGGTGTTATGTTMVADTWVKLGQRIKHNGNALVGEMFVNGVPIATTFTATNIPVVALTPSWVSQNHTTTRVKTDFDWVKFGHAFPINT